MAATIAVVESAGQAPSRPTNVRRVTVLGDSSYPSGGYAFSLGDGFEGEDILAVIPQPAEGNANAKVGEYDYAVDKLLFLDGALAEVTGATDVSTQTITCIVVTQ